ncbi:MAG: hypothetical protein ABSB73_06605 [Solirubrobacteraceae bacterium]
MAITVQAFELDGQEALTKVSGLWALIPPLTTTLPDGQVALAVTVSPGVMGVEVPWTIV